MEDNPLFAPDMYRYQPAEEHPPAEKSGSSPYSVTDEEKNNPLIYDPEFRDPSHGEPAANYADMPAREVFTRAIKNAPSSGVNTVASMMTPILHPIDTANAMYQTGKGAVSKVKGALGYEQDSAKKHEDEATLDAIAEMYKQRYGSVAGFKKALAEDPVGVMADASMALSGAGGLLSRTPVALGEAGAMARTAGKALSAAGEMSNPVTAPFKMVGAAGKYAPKLINKALSVTADVDPSSMNVASDIGLGGVRGDTPFGRALRGETSADEIVGDFRNAISDVSAKRRADYVSGMSDLNKSMLLPFDDVDKALAEARKIAYYGSLDASRGPTLQRAFNAAERLVDDWRDNSAVAPGEYRSLEGFDALKQAISELNGEPELSKGNAIFEKIRNGVKKTIMNADPKYSDVMDKYGEASDFLNKQAAEFKTKPGREGLGLRKLLKAQKDAYRSNLLDELSPYAPDLKQKLAGMDFNQSHGHSILGGGSPLFLNYVLSGGMTPTGLAAAVAGAAAGSPSTAARIAGGVGDIGRGMKYIGDSPSRLMPTIESLYGIGSAEDRLRDSGYELPPIVVEPDYRPKHAKGGRARPLRQTASALLAAVNRAKREIQNETKPILEQPDERVVGALAVANQHI